VPRRHHLMAVAHDAKRQLQIREHQITQRYATPSLSEGGSCARNAD
jgi:hypothetical protein